MLAKRTFWILCSSTLVKGLAFANGIILPSLLTVSQYGAYSELLYLCSLLALIMALDVPVACAKYLAEVRFQRSEAAMPIMRTGMWLVSIAGVGTVVVIILAAKFIAHKIYPEADLTPYVRFCAFIALAMAFVALRRGFVLGYQQIPSIVFAEVLMATLQTTLFYFLSRHWRLSGTVAAMLLANLAALAFLVWRSRNLSNVPVSSSSAPRESFTAPLLKFGLPSFLGSGLVTLGFLAVRVILTRVSGGGEATGRFQVADTISNIVLLVPQAMAVPLVPTISESAKNSAAIRDIVGRVTRFNAHMLFPLALFVAMAGPAVFSWVFRPEYHSAWVPAYILCMGHYLYAIGIPLGACMYGMGQVGLALAMILIWLGSLSIGNLFLVHKYAEVGTCLALLASFAVNVVSMLIAMRRLVKARYEISYALPFIVCAAFAVGFLIARTMHGIPLILVAGVFSLAMGAVSLALLKPTDRKRILDTLRKFSLKDLVAKSGETNNQR